MSSFVHLHVHSHYSLLDGMSQIKELVQTAMSYGMSSIALTDHGVMYGIKDLADTVDKLENDNKDMIKKNRAIIESESSTEKEKADAQAKIDGSKWRPFKPIFGVEAYCARRSLYDKDKTLKMVNAETGKERVLDQSGWHLILLAKNSTGYKNLCKMVSISWVDGFYSRPRIDKNLLEKYHEGIIVCSACLGGELPQLIIAGKLDEAEKSINWFKSIFGDDYYIEIQRHQTDKPNADTSVYQRQCEVNPHLIELARKTNTKIIATNDVHFVKEEYGEAHDRLICLGTGVKLSDTKRMHYTKQEWLKSPDEMAAIFSDIPEALANTLEIENKVERYSINSKPIMPMFDIPEEFGTEEEYRKKFTHEDLFNEFTQNDKGEVVLSREEAEKKVEKLGGYDKLYRIKLEGDYLEKLTWEGAKMRYGDTLTQDQRDRIIFELYIMKTMGFPGYFLIVSDYIRASREELGVWVGPGRGSAAGSVVAYCLKITDIDPLKYNLLFERFLNPDRISLPDIDVDFDDDGRNNVLRWVTDKYGKERVAHIITYGTMATKSSIKDVARVYDLQSLGIRLTGFVPDKFPKDPKTGKAPSVSLSNCFKYVPEMKAALEGSDKDAAEILHYADELENTIRQIGVHACGVIIGADDLTKFVPISTAYDKNSGEDVFVTQYDGHVIESVGLIKMDFLGLATLSIIKEAVETVKQTTGDVVDIDHIPIDDPKTYDLFCKGQTVGTFQFESPGMQKYLRSLHPTQFEDLIAMNALYRPGPMDNIPQFIDCKHGVKPVVYDIPCMETYLKETYGVTVYQEQVMLLSRMLGNFTRGESDTLRKAMGKKNREQLDKMKSKFISGGISNGHDPKVLEKIWADWEKFAEYAFNKSHAACYTWISYQTAWLKAHYPSQYMAAVLSRSLNNTSEVTKMLSECKNMGIKVLGPDVNHSQSRFSVTPDGDIRYGLGAIKGMGEGAAQSIVESRGDKPFTDIFNFISRINMQVINRKCLEAMVLAGAFDNLASISRCAFLEPDSKGVTFLDTLMRYGQKIQVEKNDDQMSLFGTSQGVELPKPEMPKYEKWPTLNKLEKEKEVTGIYLSSHPLDEYSFEMNHLCKIKLADLSDLAKFKDCDVSFAGMVVDTREALTKTNKNYARITIEDYSDKYDIMLFGKDFTTFKNFATIGYFLMVEGRVQNRTYGNTDELEFKIKSIQMLSDAKSKIKAVTVVIPLRDINSVMIDDFVKKITDMKGKVTLKVKIVDSDEKIAVETLSQTFRVDVNAAFDEYIQQNEYGLEVKCG